MSPTALITGASRGIGARVAVLLAAAGYDVLINYRCRQLLAERVAADILPSGRRAWLHQADLTDPEAVESLAVAARTAFGSIDVLVLNASGGLEAGMPDDYPHQVNVRAPLGVVDAMTPIMPAGGRIIYVTSHHAHFHGRVDTVPEYAPIAATKRAGEDALRARLPELAHRGLSLVVVSGDLVEGTVTAVWLQRRHPDLFTRRRAGGAAPITLDEFATAVADAATRADRPSGATVYVGSTH